MRFVLGIRALVKRQNTLRDEIGSVVDHEGVYRAHKARIVGLCRLLLRDPEEGEDVAQEVFLRAFKHFRGQEAPAIWEAWLVRVAVNACRDKQRSGWWKSLRKRAEFDEVIHGVFSPSSEAEAVARERQVRIWRQLRTLKTEPRNVFVLRYVEGWSTIEVAEALGLSVAGVKTHLFRAIRHLREALEP